MKESMEEIPKKLSYSTLSLDMVRKRFSISIALQDLFSDIAPVSPSDLLKTTLQRAADLSLLSEKARSEFIVAPILLEVREALHHTISIYSGVRLDVSPEEGLQGVCDFIIAKSPPLPTLQAPLIIMVEAKKNDIEEGLGQCAAEMIAAQRFNQEEDPNNTLIYGVVTTGELWQFLQLEDKNLHIEPTRIYIEHIDKILGILLKMGAS
jgi:hypothetical protein